MLNGVRMRGLGVALATVHRAEAAADEKDEVRPLLDLVCESWGFARWCGWNMKWHIPSWSYRSKRSSMSSVWHLAVCIVQYSFARRTARGRQNRLHF